MFGTFRMWTSLSHSYGFTSCQIFSLRSKFSNLTLVYCEIKKNTKYWTKLVCKNFGGNEIDKINFNTDTGSSGIQWPVSTRFTRTEFIWNKVQFLLLRSNTGENNSMYNWEKRNSLWGQSERCETKCGDAFVDCVIGCQADSGCQSNCNRNFAACKLVQSKTAHMSEKKRFLKYVFQ